MAASGLLRVIAVGLRRYSREPETRPNSARIMLGAAVALMAAETSPGETALAAAEFLASLSAQARREAAERRA